MPGARGEVGGPPLLTQLTGWLLTLCLAGGDEPAASQVLAIAAASLLNKAPAGERLHPPCPATG